MISQTLWLIIDALVIVGILMYGSGKALNISYEGLKLFNDLGKLLVIISVCSGVLSLYFWYEYKKMY